MDLPSELLNAVVELLDYKADLRSVRLVDKRFAAIGATHLFSTIHISAIRKDVEDARSSSQRFGSCIKTITISGALKTLGPFAARNHHFRERLRDIY